jgi:hypothetical protein
LLAQIVLPLATNFVLPDISHDTDTIYPIDFTTNDDVNVHVVNIMNDVVVATVDAVDAAADVVGFLRLSLSLILILSSLLFVSLFRWGIIVLLDGKYFVDGLI